MTEPVTIILRERVLGAAELVCVAWAVLGYEVLHIFPAQVPVLMIGALGALRLVRWLTA